MLFFSFFPPVFIANIYNCNNCFGSCQGCSWESLISLDKMGTHTYEFNNTREKRKDIVSYIDTESAVCVLKLKTYFKH